MDHEEDITGDVEQIHEGLVSRTYHLYSDHTVNLLQNNVFVSYEHQIQQEKIVMSWTARLDSSQDNRIVTDRIDVACHLEKTLSIEQRANLVKQVASTVHLPNQYCQFM